MGSEKNIVKFWRGSRAAYNALGSWDYWTRYSVYEGDENGNHIAGEPYVEYYGTTCITPVAGQLLPVKTVCTTLPGELELGDRFLVGHDAFVVDGVVSPSEYFIIEIGPIMNADGVTYRKASMIKPFNKQSVRVIDRNMKEYFLSNGKLITYDDVDCGEF